jgi:hypothetical protein
MSEALNNCTQHRFNYFVVGIAIKKDALLYEWDKGCVFYDFNSE